MLVGSLPLALIMRVYPADQRATVTGWWSIAARNPSKN
jgi:hypothetical protein